MSIVVVVDYDPIWPALFEELRGPIRDRLGDLAIAIEHVGSTAVPGLAAKPIIDLTVVVRTRADVRAAIDALASIGYTHRGTLGVEDRDAFGAPAGSPRQHLYVCPQGSLALENHLAVRDHLRADAGLRDRYGSLKRDLARRFPDDIDRYVDGKTDFILSVLRRTDLGSEQLARIEAANRV